MTGRRIIGLYYFLLFGSIGAIMPFVPLILRERGLSPATVSQILLISPVASIFVPPLWGWLADRLQIRHGMLTWATLLTAVSTAALAMGSAQSLWLFALLFFCFRFFSSPIGGLVDASAHAVLPERAEFAKLRLWGSLGFALAALASGRMEGATHPARVFAVATTLLVFAGLTTLFVPRPVMPLKKAHPGAVKEILHSRTTRLLWMGAIFHYAAQSSFDSYFGFYVRDLGFSEQFFGLCWAVGVMAEFLLMFRAPALFARFSAPRLLFVVVLIAALRWPLYLLTQNAFLIVCLQTLHAVSFGLWFLCQVKCAQDEAPENLRTFVQSSLMAAMGVGTCMGLLLGGESYARWQSQGTFLLATACSTVGVGIYWLLQRRLGLEFAAPIPQPPPP